MHEPILIGLVGRARVGKDTAAEYLVESGFRSGSFADPLKDMLETVFGPHFRSGDREQPIEWLGKSPRELMQTLGTEWGRDCVHRDLWVLLAHRRWQSIKSKCAGMVFTDVRFENEAGWITSQGGYLIEVTRSSAQPVNPHSSEQADLSELCDFRVENEGTFNHLYVQLEGVLDLIKGRGY